MKKLQFGAAAVAWMFVSVSVSNAQTPSTTDLAGQITDLQNQLKLLQAQQALSNSAITLKTDAANAQNSLVTAENGLLNSQIAGAKALIPTVQSGVPGAIGGDGGTIRATVDAWKDLDPAFAMLAEHVKQKAGADCILLVNPASLDDYATSQWVAQSLAVVAGALPNKIKSLEALTPPELLLKPEVPPPAGVSPSGFLAPALAGTLIDSVVSFSKLFRTDRNITGTTVTTSSDTLYSLATGKLIDVGCKVTDVDHLVVPGQNYLDILKESPLYTNLQKVQTQMDDLDNKYAVVSANTMKKEADSATPKSTAAVYDVAVARWKDASDKLHASIDPIASIPVSATDAFALKVLRGLVLADLMDTQKGKILYTKVEALGGTRVTKKKTFVSDKEYLASSYVVSWRLVDGKGGVIGAGKSQANGGYTLQILP